MRNALAAKIQLRKTTTRMTWTLSAEQVVADEWKLMNGPVAASAGRKPVYKNKLPRTIHQVKDAAKGKFGCGKANSANYTRLGDSPMFAYPTRCRLKQLVVQSALRGRGCCHSDLVLEF